MRTIIIVILVLLVVGLYYAPDMTKGIMKTTGNAVYEVGKKGVETVKDSESIKELGSQIKEKTFNITIED